MEVGRVTFGSLFAGIGGIDLGLERAGLRCAWQVEIDPDARRVLAHHWPDVPRHEDVCGVGAHNLPSVDVVAGGFPCQDISVAGRGAGISGARSGLWWQMRRIVDELRPHWVLAENVAALRTRGSDAVLASLEESGYATWPLVVGAWAVGAPHRRNRVWVLGRRLADTSGTRLEGEGEGLSRLSGHTLADADGDGQYREWLNGIRQGQCVDGTSPLRGADVDGRYRWPARPAERQYRWESPRTTQSVVGRAVDGVSRELARRRRTGLRLLGNAVVPQIPELIGRLILCS